LGGFGQKLGLIACIDRTIAPAKPMKLEQEERGLELRKKLYGA
jgi:hypothetical protein